MKISADIRRTDLLLFSLLMAPRLRSTYVGFAALMAFIFCALLWLRGFPHSAHAWYALVGATIGGTIGGLVAGGLVTWLLGLISNPTANGAIGMHEYEITDSGLAYKSGAHAGTTTWSGIRRVGRIRSFLYVQISEQLFFLIPRRAFETSALFNAFHHALQSAVSKSA